MRKLLVYGMIALGLALQFTALHAQTESLPNGVASGDVTQESVILWTRSTVTGLVTFEVLVGETVVQTLTAEVTDPTLPVKVEVTGLQAGTSYRYRVTDAGGSRLEGNFRTPAALGEHRGVRFGVTGDWRGDLSPYPAITNMAGQNLDFVVLHGDTIYADVPSPDVPLEQATTVEEYRAKHAEGYGERYGLNAWADVRASTPIFVTIDDHEVTNDFAGGAAPSSDERFADETVEFINDTALYETGLQVFQEYNPLRDEFYGDTGDPLTSGERKLYRYRTFGSDAAIFVLDSRSFRSTPIPPLESFDNLGAILTYLNATYDPTRTFLGKVQLDDLLRDLAQAEADGITWKFILLPEPVQNLGVVAASDRYEGYAAERREVLQFIVENNIRNVVFVAADIHGTLVNELIYQEQPFAPATPVPAFEITTNATAYYPPFGPTVVGIAQQIGLLDEAGLAAYQEGDAAQQEATLMDLMVTQLSPLGYPMVGLDDTDAVEATLLQGGYSATHTYGWTEFAIDATTQTLLVTSYGIPFYSPDEITADPQAILSRTPTIVSQFEVTPK